MLSHIAPFLFGEYNFLKVANEVARLTHQAIEASQEELPITKNVKAFYAQFSDRIVAYLNRRREFDVQNFAQLTFDHFLNMMAKRACSATDDSVAVRFIEKVSKEQLDELQDYFNHPRIAVRVRGISRFAAREIKGFETFSGALIARGCTKAVTKLIEKEALKPRAPFCVRSEEPCWHQTVRNGHHAFIKQLAQKKICYLQHSLSNGKNKAGETAAELARKLGNRQVIEALPQD